MKMIDFLSYSFFALSIGLAIIGILISVRLRKEYQNGFTSALIYAQIFTYAFGFYAIWGQVFTGKFLAEYISGTLMDRILTSQVLVGLPFMILSMYMLIRFSLDLQKRKVSRFFTLAFILVCTGGLILVGYYSFKDSLTPTQLYLSYYMLLVLLSHLITGTVLLYKPAEKTRINRKKLNLLSILIISSGILQALILYLFETEGYVALVFVIVFFATYSFIPLILRYYGIMSSYIKSQTEEINLDDFCPLYDISQREKEIIMELCKGHTNKEIADNLFISLQTVKDHTHRIYIKTGLRNRVELVNRIRNISAS